MNLSREQQNELLFVGFNQDSGKKNILLFVVVISWF
jgi:hypothetical protein